MSDVAYQEDLMDEPADAGDISALNDVRPVPRISILQESQAAIFQQGKPTLRS